MPTARFCSLPLLRGTTRSEYRKRVSRAAIKDIALEVGARPNFEVTLAAGRVSTGHVSYRRIHCAARD